MTLYTMPYNYILSADGAGDRKMNITQTNPAGVN